MTALHIPYTGSKAKAAALVWQRFGVVARYIEPFAGSGAVALANPYGAPVNGEILNDLDGVIANFWRAVQADPDSVAEAADWPPSQIDLMARQQALIEARPALGDLLRRDPHACDLELAGWWLYGALHWLGSEFARDPADGRKAGFDVRPDLASINRRKRWPDGLAEPLRAMARRLRETQLWACDWTACVKPRVLDAGKGEISAVFLDPPYTAKAGRRQRLYPADSLSVADEVAAWAAANGEDYRIALCGIDGEHAMPRGWDKAPWRNGNGYRLTPGSTTSAGQEVIWFSPRCKSLEDSGQSAALM